MSHHLDLAFLLLIPLLIVSAFTFWVLWNFTRELRQGRRRRVRSSRLIYGHEVRIYEPEPQVLRFRRHRDHEA